jgi:hypothetical protein
MSVKTRIENLEQRPGAAEVGPGYVAFTGQEELERWAAEYDGPPVYKVYLGGISPDDWPPAGGNIPE